MVRPLVDGSIGMLRSELIVTLKDEFGHLRPELIEQMAQITLDEIAVALEKGQRVELRGFGAFSVRTREARQGRNPRTGETVKVAAKRVPFFKPGKELRERVND
jgi:integration host factor subunit beta